MRLATLAADGGSRLALVDGGRLLPLALDGLDSLRALAAAGDTGLAEIGDWARGQRPEAYRALDRSELGPAVPDPGAIFTIGRNYRSRDEEPDGDRPERPLVYGKIPTAVTASGATIAWDRSVTAKVDGECELGVVMGADGSVFGYTIVNDVTSQDPWLDGDQWLLGKSLPGFCPVGPWVVTADELDPADLRLGFRLNGVPVQDGRTSQMRHSITDVIAYLGRHVQLRTGDLIATGTPGRIGPHAERHLQAGDTMTAWIDGIGELNNTIA